MDEIEPCPTCNAEDCRIGSDGYVDANLRPAFFVVCDNMDCNLIGPNRPTKEQAIIDWNRLSRAARLLAAVEELEQAGGDFAISFERNNAIAIVSRDALTKELYLSHGSASNPWEMAREPIASFFDGVFAIKKSVKE